MKKTIYKCLIIIFSLGVIYSICYYISYKIDQNKIVKELETINEAVKIEEINDNKNTEVVNNNKTNNTMQQLINADFSELKKINSDVKGWITVNGTNINYPFVQSNDNNYYLKHSFDKSRNSAGWVFLDYRNNLINDKNTILYAHSMLNKTMFGTLRNVLKNGWLKNKNNFVIKLSSEKENTLWQIVSIYHIEETSDYIKTSFKDNEDFTNFANMILDRSVHNFNETIEEDDRILTLSTCYNNKERLVVHAKLIKKMAK